MPLRRASAAPCTSILRPASPDHARRARRPPIVLAALSSRPPRGRPVPSLERQFQPPGGPPQLCCRRRRVRSHTKTLRNRYPVNAELFTTRQVVSHSARSVLGFRAPISVELATLDYRRTCNLTSCWAANLSRATWGKMAFSLCGAGGSDVQHRIRWNRGCVRHEFGFFSTTRDPKHECRQAITTAVPTSENGNYVAPDAILRLDAKAAADDFLHDLGGAAVDRLHSRVEICTCDRVFAHVPVTAVELQAAVDQVHLLLGGIPLGHRGLFDGEFLLEVQRDELIDHDPHHRGLSCQFGE